MKTKIANIEHVIEKGFEKCRKFNKVIVAIGRYEEDDSENNIINIIPIKNKGSVHSKSTLIETSIKDVRDVAELAIYCLLKSKLKFKSVSMENMDGSKVDVNNPKASIRLDVIIKEDKS